MFHTICILLKFFFFKTYLHGSNKRLHHECMIFCAIFVLSNVSLANADSRENKHGDARQSVLFGDKDEVVVTLDPIDSEQGFHSAGHLRSLRVLGTLARVGSSGEDDGTIYQMPPNDCGFEDELIYSKHPKNWVALFHYVQVADHLTQDSSRVNDTSCLTITERVKNAMMFGASAILILVLNPKIVSELDIAQLFSQPVVLIQTATNVTAVMEAIVRHAFWKVKISTKKIKEPQTVTVWSMCWRSRPGSGVVCQSASNLSKEDPGHFWNYFFSLLATLILLMILKTNGGQDDDLDNLDQGQVIRRMALHALAVMTIKRFQPPSETTHTQAHLCNTKELCAICLDNFYVGQRLRVLPCTHEFHTKCVDPWLLKQPTCPLCKLNIIDLQPQERSRV